MEWPIAKGGQTVRLYTPSASQGQTITAAASANAKGGWVEVSASTPANLSGLLVTLSAAGGAGRDYLVDIGVGPAGQEVVLVPNLLYCAASDDAGVAYHLPVAVPAGVRLAVRCQCSVANSTAVIAIHGIATGYQAPYGSIAAYGAVAADSGGTLYDPGATVNTKGGKTEIVAATTAVTLALLVAIGNNRNSNQVGQYHYLLDVCVGPAGQERVVIPDLYFQVDVNSDARIPCVFGPFPVDIPAGSRLSVEAQCSGNDATDRLFDVILYAFS